MSVAGTLGTGALGDGTLGAPAALPAIFAWDGSTWRLAPAAPPLALVDGTLHAWDGSTWVVL